MGTIHNMWNMWTKYLAGLNYHMSGKERREKITDKRLHKFVKFARKNSPAIAKLYEGISDDFKLSDLPITSKKMIMENYDSWCTQPGIRLDDAKAFVADTSNVGKLFLDKYVVVTTSGSTGYPLIYLMSAESINAMSTEAVFVGQTKKRPMATLTPGNRFLIPTSVLRENLRRFPFLEKFGVCGIDSSISMEHTVNEIARIRPRSLQGTASTIAVIADECQKRGLDITIDEILCGSELLTHQTREYLESSFHGKARNIYGCTECGNLGFECDEHHIHLHNSWVILEPVDDNYNPVPPGTPSTKVLMTNLASYTMPIIRYEVTDKITVHTEPCPCGKKEVWIDMDGRTASMPLEFKVDGESKKISPMPVYWLIETLNTIRRFQFVVHGYDTFECRIIFMPDVDQTAVFEQVKQILTEYLRTSGVTSEVKFYLSDTEPQIDPVTMKFKSVYQVFD